MAVRSIRNSIGMRLFIIAFLTLILLIPSLMIHELIQERMERRDEATLEVSGKWGAEQVVIGPVLTLPYRYFLKDEKQNTIETVRYAHFLPEELKIDGSLAPEIRYRGIYEVILYKGQLDLNGFFASPDPSLINLPEKDILWNEAFLALGISDMKGIREFVSIEWNGSAFPANPGLPNNDVIQSGISIKPLLSQTQTQYNFHIRLDLNGSSGLLFSPVGKETLAGLKSDWTNPSFMGDFLPEERNVDNSGFTAKWKVLHLNRNFPQAWIGTQNLVGQTLFGVNLQLAVDEYQKTMRTAKYAIMFIALTFLTFFMIELLTRRVIHPIQYLLIGFALLVFYTLLLSISEYLIFAQAYWIASISIIVMITLYARSVLADNLQTLIIAGVLILLYGYLFILLQLQDYALLMGSIGLFVVLGLVMYLTRKIDWFGIMESSEVQK